VEPVAVAVARSQSMVAAQAQAAGVAAALSFRRPRVPRARRRFQPAPVQLAKIPGAALTA
jgi:hypothetical protein